jgi:hypothetical protein
MKEPTETTAAELLGETASPAPAVTPSPAAEASKPSPVAVTADPASESGVTPPPASEPNPFAGQKDSLRREFIPSKFRVKDGRPQLDSMGRYVPLGFGKKGGSSLPDGATPAAPVSDSGSQLPPDENSPEEMLKVDAELSVQVAIGLVQTALIMIGEEEGELTELEVKMLRGPMLRVLQKYGMQTKMTPELETAAVIALFIQRRLKKPKTQSWFLSRLQWLKAWWNTRRIRNAVPEAAATSATH